MELEITENIVASPERVFALVSDVARWPEFISAIQRVEILAPGPLTCGTRFRETRKMFGRESTEEMIVETIDAPKLLRLTAQNHGTAYVADHIVEQAGDVVRLTLRFEGQPTTLMARLLFLPGLVMLRSVRRQLEADLRDIKRAAESASAG